MKPKLLLGLSLVLSGISPRHHERIGSALAPEFGRGTSATASSRRDDATFD